LGAIRFGIAPICRVNRAIPRWIAPYELNLTPVLCAISFSTAVVADRTKKQQIGGDDMPGQDNTQNEPRDERGRWPTGGSRSADTASSSDLLAAARAALSGTPMADAQDRLDVVASRIDKDSGGDVGAALATGKADGAGLVADMLNHISMHPKGKLSPATAEIATILRGVVIGLQPGQSDACARLRWHSCETSSADQRERDRLSRRSRCRTPSNKARA
jgi:hypothetical protein